MSQDELFSILQAFASLTPIRNLSWPTTATAEEIQPFLIDQFISSEHFRLYPPSVTYQKSFWKWIISRIEDRGEEVAAEIYSRYLSLLDQLPTEAMISPVRSSAPSYVTYTWRDSLATGSVRLTPEVTIENCRKCTLSEARTIIESGTTGLRTWTASFVLAEYLTKQRSMLKSSRTIELGCGAGFLGIVLAQSQMEELDDSCASGSRARPSLCLTDFHGQVLKRCESNIRLPCNQITEHPDLRVASLDWTDALDSHRRDDLVAFFKELKADLIIGADLVYDVSIIPALVATLHLALTAGHTVSPRKKAIIAATRRNEDTLRHFTTEVEESGLRIEKLDTEQKEASSHFLWNQPDAIGESASHVTICIITSESGMR